MKKISKTVRLILTWLLMAMLLFGTGVSAFAEEPDEDETVESVDEALLTGVDQDLLDANKPSEENLEYETSEGIHYTRPMEALEAFGKKFVGFFKGIVNFFKGLQEKLPAGAFWAIVAGCIALVVLFFASMAVAFKKAGVQWWLALIPVVDVYYCFKIGWETEKAWVALAALGAAVVIGLLADIKELPWFGGVYFEVPGIITTILSIVKIIGYALLFIFSIRLAEGWAEGFGLHFSFGIGLWILFIIFLPILAFTPTTYKYKLGTGQVDVD